MTGHEALWEAQRVIGKLWKKGPSPEQAELLGFARDTLNFISETGQRHRFHDARASLSTRGSTLEPPAPTALLGRTEVFFTRLLQEAAHPDPPDFAHILVAGGLSRTSSISRPTTPTSAAASSSHYPSPKVSTWR